MFRVNPQSIVACMSKNSLLEKGAVSEVYTTATGMELSLTTIKKKSNKSKQKRHICFKDLATSPWMIGTEKGIPSDLNKWLLHSETT